LEICSTWKREPARKQKCNCSETFAKLATQMFTSKAYKSENYGDELDRMSFSLQNETLCYITRKSEETSQMKRDKKG
jgi:hypothetical protein